ncbi:uncharacterized protein N7473_011125 [Penicillium subrubescens]|uniref:uncharacterized protein n=1 Tax=Penicillium subrubescens TaxID=1316194 RepID=UPI002544FB72|nr:uncharacterized protein N7473_011125 [Penicillium subrubescens]KAJ5882691.1 hypothetical protein N7473_011125 [Penicillium subrubescens]
MRYHVEVPVMSGPETAFVVDLISRTISKIEVIKTVYDAAKDAQGQPEAFRQVAARLPLVIRMLHSAKERAQVLDETAQEALEPTLGSYKAKVEALQKIFQKVVRKDDDKWYDRYKKTVVGTLGKQGSVEGLMEGILKDIHVLVCGKLIGTATDAEVQEIKEAMKQMKDMPSSLTTATAVSLTNRSADALQQHSGSGDNILVTGGSVLSLHKGIGNRYVISGDVYF